jgi:hypothetical protein
MREGARGTSEDLEDVPRAARASKSWGLPSVMPLTSASRVYGTRAHKAPSILDLARLLPAAADREPVPRDGECVLAGV